MRDTKAELDWVRRELERLVVQRLDAPFTAKEQEEFERLLSRERELLAEIRATRGDWR